MFRFFSIGVRHFVPALARAYFAFMAFSGLAKLQASSCPGTFQAQGEISKLTPLKNGPKSVHRAPQIIISSSFGPVLHRESQIKRRRRAAGPLWGLELTSRRPNIDQHLDKIQLPIESLGPKWRARLQASSCPGTFQAQAEFSKIIPNKNDPNSAHRVPLSFLGLDSAQFFIEEARSNVDAAPRGRCWD